jgi:phage gp36-like protein
VSQSIKTPPSGPRVLVANSPAEVIYKNACDLLGAYASIQDLDDLVVAENVQHDFTTRSKEKWLRVAARIADSYVGQRFKTPLSMWSDAWIWANCEIAIHGLMHKRGDDPDKPSNKSTEMDKLAAVQWIMAARDYEITPDQRLALTEPAKVATMKSYRPRGWNGPSFPRGGWGRGGGGFF